MQSTKNNLNGQVETHWRGRLTDNSSSFYGAAQPKTMQDLVPERKHAAMTTVSEVLPRQPPKLLLKVMIMESLGAVQVLMTPEKTVRDLIAAAMRQYVKEGRCPILSSSDPFRFVLHYSQFSLESQASRRRASRAKTS
ncbi:uncharacterized protein [Cicer arietinum]|uniref:Uncharacterized protein LOC101501077 isoform X2 n=1 Tax=Cicer arietinum TaxID=3827 RepID=A0A1S3E7N3_CICAR|nr:uncharacterized protein LOC101501077 isoform X2 [Cicer arietinum]